MTVLTAALAILSGPSPLEAAAAADRASALAAARTAANDRRAKRMRELQELAIKAGAEADAEIAAAEAAVERRRVEASADIVRDWTENGDALLKRWREDPTRERSEALRSLLLRIAARCEHELGAPLHCGVLLELMAAPEVETNPASATVFSENVSPKTLDAARAVELAASVGPVAFARALEELEEVVERAARACVSAPRPEAVARFRTARGWITGPDRAKADQDFAAEQKRSEDAAFAATYTRPKNFTFGGLV